MDNLKLDEQEHRYFAELFAACDVDNTGKVPGVKASELFLTSGLPLEALAQIAELCGAKRLGHFGRPQFYIALKLIAIAQCGLPISLDSLNSGTELPNLKFTRPEDNQERRRNHHNIESNSSDSVERTNQTGALPPPPGRHNIRNHSNPRIQSNINSNNKPQDITDGSPNSPRRIVGKQQSLPSQALSNQYTNNINNSTKKEKGWASFEDEAKENEKNTSDDEDNKGLINDESKEWAQFSDRDHPKADTSSITSSEAESVDDVCVISDEQREYYINQFKSMQPDLTGVILGAKAKEFFEKSKLPVHELSKIWQLSDVNKDGALSLEEFCTAMHLVVLRRNDVELPDKLPPSLMPYAPLVNDEPFAADLPPGSTLKRTSPNTPPHDMWAPSLPTFPTDSPSSSVVSSPGSKPVNFDYKPVTSDPDSKIIHPVALRMSPDGKPIQPPDFIDRGRAFSDPSSETLQQDSVLSPTRQRSTTEVDLENKFGVPLQSRPRPTPKKAQSVSGAPLVLPPPTSNSQLTPNSDATAERPSTLAVGNDVSVPAVPPRTNQEHNRSASLDLNKDDKVDGKDSLAAPLPAVPPRPSPRDISGAEGSAGPAIGPGGDAFDSPIRGIQRDDSRDDLTGAKRSARQMSKDKQDLLTLIRQLKERNAMLARTNCELNQELQEVMEQRIGLEIQLEHLRPFSN